MCVHPQIKIFNQFYVLFYVFVLTAAHESKSCPSVSVEEKVDVTFRSESVTSNIVMNPSLSDITNTQPEGANQDDKNDEVKKDLGAQDLHPTLEAGLAKDEVEPPQVAVLTRTPAVKRHGLFCRTKKWFQRLGRRISQAF